MNTRIILVGRPGCGKGTFLKRVLTAGGYQPATLPMSDELKRIASGSPEYKAEIELAQKSGSLVPNKIVVPALLNVLPAVQDKPFVVFDGVPRDAEQLYALSNGLRTMDGSRKSRTIVIHLQTREVICGWRLCLRANQENREDDNPTSIVRRMMEYDQFTKPCVDMLQHHSMPTFGWEFMRLNGNDIHGSAEMFRSMLHLPEELKAVTP